MKYNYIIAREGAAAEAGSIRASTPESALDGVQHRLGEPQQDQLVLLAVEGAAAGTAGRPPLNTYRYVATDGDGETVTSGPSPEGELPALVFYKL